ncbi:MAG: adenylosuccinate lyase [Reichenbachiella sp.]|uniref:adenylosuccinate lyase n=1 Tax=Reichenbachiella sp. TaxID=2184521 RepID=UPI0032639DF3
MELNALTAISPVDGRYRRHTASLAEYFSEFGLIKYRVHVEIEYFIALCQHPLPQLKEIDSSVFGKLRQVVVEFSEKDAQAIKDIEKTTNHDVKAVEYFIKARFDDLDLTRYKEFIHFGLTSQDINNTAIPLQLKHAVENEYLPLINEITGTLMDLAETWKDIPMLAKTHGQPASPTLLGKEILVFHERLTQQINMLDDIRYGAKFGGATGNMNAHHIAYPEIDWIKFANNFVDNTLGLRRSYPTTQIEHYDDMAALFDNLKRINTILIDFSRDIWQYISMGYFKQKVVKGEVGSSAMPHKVNPIDFENAEGNLGIANANYDFLAGKLPISRLQRDLTDSTVLRNVGVPVSHSFIALKSLQKGIGKLELNQHAIEYDLDQNWAVVSEAIQTILRREAYPEPYEALKALTRGNNEITHQVIKEFVDTLDVSDELKTQLKEITPFNYTGINPLG